MTISLALLLITICVAIFGVIYEWDSRIAPLLVMIIIGLFIWTALDLSDAKSHKIILPTALDVYRGKTTLEITYRDSVAVDSAVVYKMK